MSKTSLKLLVYLCLLTAVYAIAPNVCLYSAAKNYLLFEKRDSLSKFVNLLIDTGNFISSFVCVFSFMCATAMIHTTAMLIQMVFDLIFLHLC